MADHPVLEAFSPAVRAWFAASFPSPTTAQVDGWPSILSGAHTLVCAPTGSGKTLTAFLASIDRLCTTEPADPKRRTRVLYISPLRALAFDVEKNLRAPMMGIGLAAERLGVPYHQPTVAMRTGDTSSRDRQALIRHPVDLLITTPESLYLMLTSSAADTLVNVDTVIIDEIHAMAATKRGAHLMLSLERLEAIAAHPPQRIGLVGHPAPTGGGGSFPRRSPRRRLAGDRSPSSTPACASRWKSTWSSPLEEMGGIWESVYPAVLAQVLAHRSTIIFCNARRQAERLAANLNELAGEELVKAHHGSLAREQRVVIEDELKRGQLRGIVATSSLELGIDMGAVDLVIQVESPGAVSRGMQRVGRAGHSVGEPSRGTLYPKHRGDFSRQQWSPSEW